MFKKRSDAKYKAFIIGQPVSHSLSPAMHNYWLQQFSIDGSYEAIEVPPDYLVKTVKKLVKDGYAGGNVTIPHKEKVMLICDEVDELAKKVGAVNTLVFEKGKIKGFNTDVYGFTENLKRSNIDITSIKNALVLGAGGAARAIIAGLHRNNTMVTISNRTPENSAKLQEEFSCDVIDWEEKEKYLGGYQLLINTTSLGMKGQPSLDIDLTNLPPGAVVTDIVYNPLETKLLKDARAAGLRTVDGLGMLLYQAVDGFEKWFGKRPEVTPELRQLLVSKI